MGAVAIGKRLGALPLPFTSSTSLYVLRSCMAAALALCVGLYLHLDSPFSAASTVLLLVNPVQGAVVGKGLHRIAGTLVGAVAAFVLVACFAQQMILLILGVGIWLGLCVAAMSVVRHYYATTAVVAGYTVCLALGPAIVEPQISFEHIVSRATAVVVGAISLTLVTVLFSRKTVEARIRDTVISLCVKAAALIAEKYAQPADEQAHRNRLVLAAEINKMDDLLGLGRGESWVISDNLKAIRSGSAYLQSALLEHELPADLSVLESTHAVSATGLQLASVSRALSEHSLSLSEAKVRVRNIRDELASKIASAPQSSHPEQRTLLAFRRLDEQLEEFALALEGFSSLEQETAHVHRPFRFHRHYADGLRNGIRALLATLLAGAVWYISGWDQGPTLLAVLGPYCTLIAAMPTPEKGTESFLRGTLYAIPAALACKFLILPQINGLPLLLVSLSLFWSFGIHATTLPSRAFQGVAFLIAFNTLVSTTLVPAYDFNDFANQSVSWIIALGICLLAYQLLPKRNDRNFDGLVEALHRETLVLLRRGAAGSDHSWQVRQQHRLASLAALAPATLDSQHQHEYLGRLSLQLARELRRVHADLKHLDPQGPIAQLIGAGLSRLARSPQSYPRMILQSHRTANSLRRLGAMHFAAIFDDLAWLLGQYGHVQSKKVRSS
jgi:uncharacterized membrane protein YccC